MTTTFHVDMWDHGHANGGESNGAFYWEAIHLPGDDTSREWRDGRLVRWVMQIELPANHHLQDRQADDFDPDAWCDVVWKACRDALDRVGWNFEASALPGPDVEVSA